MTRSGATIIPFPAHRRVPQRTGEPFITKHQAARFLCVSTRTIERYQREGLPFHRAGGVNLYRRSEIEAWVCGTT